MSPDVRINQLQARVSHYETALLDMLNLQQTARQSGVQPLEERFNRWIPELMADLNRLKKDLANEEQRVAS